MVFKLNNKKVFIVILSIIMIYTVILCTSTVMVSSKPKQDTIKVPVIMYHHFCTNSKKINTYTIHPKLLEEDLKYIKQNGYTTITMTDLINYCKGNGELPKKPIMITIDDGFESIYTYVYPLMKKYDMCAVIGIVGSFADFSTKEQDHNIEYSYLNWEQISELSNTKYFEIQNHSYNMHSCTSNRIGTNRKYGESKEHYVKALKEDVTKNQELIFKYTGTMPNTFVYPFGNNSDLSKEVLKNLGMSAALTCEDRVNQMDETSDLMKIKRFNRANKKTTKEFFKKVFE